MKRKYSLAYLTIPGADPVEQIKIAKEVSATITYSLRTIPMRLPGEPEFLLEQGSRSCSRLPRLLWLSTICL